MRSNGGTHPAARGAVTPRVIPGGFRPDVARAKERPSLRGATLFFTGLSGSGKSTLARLTAERFTSDTGRPVSVLDGDVVRRHLTADLGFSPEDRHTNILRVGFVAAEVTRHGGLAICALIAPFERSRQEVRRMVEAVGPFVLVHLSTPLVVCEARDPKGLYVLARAGQIERFTGISDVYEPPLEPSLDIDTSAVTPVAAVDQILDLLRTGGLLHAAER